MSPALRLSLWIAALQGTVLWALHGLADGGYGVWPGLQFLLPVYAVSVGAPLTWYLLAAQLPLRALVRGLGERPGRGPYLDGDGQEEAVVLASAETTVYARLPGSWARVGQLLSGRYPSADALQKALEEGRWRAAPPGRYRGLELGTSTYVFVPSECDPGDTTCS